MSLEALKFLQETISDLKNENENRRYAISELYTKDEDEEDIERESEIIAENEIQIKHFEFGIKCLALGLFIHHEISLGKLGEIHGLKKPSMMKWLEEKGVSHTFYGEEDFIFDLKYLKETAEREGNMEAAAKYENWLHKYEKEQKPMWKQAKEQANKHMDEKNFTVRDVQEMFEDIRRDRNEKEDEE